MSVASELQSLISYLQSAYSKIADKGGSEPLNKNMYELVNAISTIPSVTNNSYTLNTVSSSATELQALQTYLQNAYIVIQAKGGTIPTNKNMANLTNAIDSIPISTSGVLAPASTKLLMHFDQNLNNEVTSSQAGITGTYNQTTGKFDFAHKMSTTNDNIYISGFAPSSGFSNYGVGLWYATNGSTGGGYGNVIIKAKNTASNTYVNCFMFSFVNGYLASWINQASFSFSNQRYIQAVPIITNYGEYIYCAIQIKNGMALGYVNGQLTFEATFNNVLADIDLNDLMIEYSSGNLGVDELIIAEDDIFMKNNAPWRLN